MSLSLFLCSLSPVLCGPRCCLPSKTDRFSLYSGEHWVYFYELSNSSEERNVFFLSCSLVEAAFRNLAVPLSCSGTQIMM